MITSSCVFSPRLGQPILATSSSSAPTSGLFSLELSASTNRENVRQTQRIFHNSWLTLLESLLRLLPQVWYLGGASKTEAWGPVFPVPPWSLGFNCPPVCNRVRWSWDLTAFLQQLNQIIFNSFVFISPRLAAAVWVITEQDALRQPKCTFKSRAESKLSNISC